MSGMFAALTANAPVPLTAGSKGEKRKTVVQNGHTSEEEDESSRETSVTQASAEQMPPPPKRRALAQTAEHAAVAHRRARTLVVLDKARSVDKSTRESTEQAFEVDEQADKQPADPSMPVRSVSGEPDASAPLDGYHLAQKHMMRAVMNAAGYDDRSAQHAAETRDAESDAMSTRAAFAQAQMRRLHVNGAAVVNDLVRKAEQQRHHLDAIHGVSGEGERAVHVLESTPYSREARSAFSRLFINKVVECVPNAHAHEREPSKEQRDASVPVRYEYVVSYMRTARPGIDFACCRGARCFGQRLMDARREPLKERTTWAVFWRPFEEAEMRKQPERWATIARSRMCIGCKLERVNNRVLASQSRNVNIAADCVESDIHVLVNLVGEFPPEATIGPGYNGHYGLYSNVPRITRVGWTARRDHTRDNCYTYHWDVPTYPIPPDYYEQQGDSSGERGGGRAGDDDDDDQPTRF